jgi:hypothetical protein
VIPASVPVPVYRRRLRPRTPRRLPFDLRRLDLGETARSAAAAIVGNRRFHDLSGFLEQCFQFFFSGCFAQIADVKDLADDCLPPDSRVP